MPRVNIYSTSLQPPVPTFWVLIIPLIFWMMYAGKNPWIHIGSTLGGSEVLSNKHKTSKKISDCDNLFYWNSHKMLCTPLKFSIVRRDPKWRKIPTMETNYFSPKITTWRQILANITSRSRENTTHLSSRLPGGSWQSGLGGFSPFFLLNTNPLC